MSLYDIRKNGCCNWNGYQAPPSTPLLMPIYLVTKAAMRAWRQTLPLQRRSIEWTDDVLHWWRCRRAPNRKFLFEKEPLSCGYGMLDRSPLLPSMPFLPSLFMSGLGGNGSDSGPSWGPRLCVQASLAICDRIGWYGLAYLSFIDCSSVID